MITLTLSQPERDPCVSAHVWPLCITATAGVGEDPKVFVFKRSADLYAGDIFWKVAAVEELSSIPADAPAAVDIFYRTDLMCYHARSYEEASAVTASVEEAVSSLNDNLAVLDDLNEETYVNSMITLTKHTVTNKTVEGQHVWPLRVVSVSSDPRVPSKIFVFHASMDDDVYVGDVFEAVASVQQLSELPEDAPGIDDNGEVCPYFRVADMTFYARTPSEADELWRSIVEDVDDLVRNLAVVTDTEETHVATGD